MYVYTIVLEELSAFAISPKEVVGYLLALRSIANSSFLNTAAAFVFAELQHWKKYMCMLLLSRRTIILLLFE